ncbi:MAG: fimbrillin family protein [Porphyromonas sp.]|nr:fimbrillin family protein [Porphyromonas sp.]
MKSLRTIISVAVLASAVLLGSCCRGGSGGTLIHPEEELRGDLKVLSTIGAMNRVSNETKWDAGDAIGIYAVPANQSVSANNLYNGKGNVKYTTPDASGVFTAASEGIMMPESGALDLVAYYPYGTANDKSVSVSFNTLDQSDLAKIDLLYSNNSKGLTKSRSTAQLHFTHQLTMVVFNLNSYGQTIDANSKLQIQDITVDGTMDLATGAIANGSTVGAPEALFKEVQAGQLYRAVLILPPQLLTGKKLVFTINGKVIEDEMPKADTESTYKYNLTVNYTKTGEIYLSVSGATIEDWNEQQIGGDPIVITPEEGGEPTPPEEEDPTPTPPVDPTPTPSETLLFPSANFEDWTAFTSSLNKYGVKLAEHSATGGRNGSGAIHLTGTDAGNGYFFTTTVVEGMDAQKLASAKQITFYIKGNVAEKSISVNVYNTNSEILYNDKGVMKPAGYVNYNLGDLTKEVSLLATTQNAYAGSIALSEWTKVTLILETEDGKKVTLPTETGNNLFALKFGKTGNYDVYVDDIMIE